MNVEDSKQAQVLKFLEASMDDANRFIKSEKTAQEDAMRHIMTMVAYNVFTNNTAASTTNPLKPEIVPPKTLEDYKMVFRNGVLNDIQKYKRFFTDSKQLFYYKYILQILQNHKKHANKHQSKKREYTLDIFNNELFPHCKSLEQKLYLLGLMTNRLIQAALGWIEPDNRDSYLNKRVELTGTLMNNLFRNLYSRFIKDFEKHIIREINIGSWNDPIKIINSTNIHKIFNPTSIENGINRALATGDFSVKQSNSGSKVGVAQVLNRLTYAASLSHIRRINTPLEKSGELIAPRKLHGTTFGYLCLAGDTDILLSNRMDTKKIKNIRDGNGVNTINRETLQDEPSDMYRYFSEMPDHLYQITTISGRKIKATKEHPFLVKTREGKYQMKKVGELNVQEDKLIIRHTILPISDENTTKVVLLEEDVLEHYRMELLEKNLLNIEIPSSKLKIIARLIGSFYFTDFDKTYEYLLEDDIRELGFDTQKEKQLFHYFLLLIKGEEDNIIPKWIFYGEKSIQREFLSVILSNISVISCNLLLPSIIIEFKSTNIKYIDKFIHSLNELNIEAFHVMDNNFININIRNDYENLNRYFDIISFSYFGEKKRKEWAPIIEYVKVMNYNKNKIILFKEFIRDNILENGCIAIPIHSIVEVEPELVYDFTTRSENHSFVASSFVVSNCPVETPEGQSIGVVKNLSIMTHITIPTQSNALYEYVKPFMLAVEDVKSPMELFGKVKVFVNGSWVGVANDPMTLYLNLKEKKYKGIINIYTSIVFDYIRLEIRVCNDGGRLTRPVLRVRNNGALITNDIIQRLKRNELSWNDLCTDCVLPESVIEYIDVEEQYYSMIAMKCKNNYIHDMTYSSQSETVDLENARKYIQSMRYTHCEIHPSTCLGVLASCIPFPHLNQAPRNTYQCAMAKQAIGISALNFDKRMDKTAYILNYPTRPLIDTRVMDFLQLNKIPSGCQVHVAIMSYTGYNQEDSILINKGAIDRGLFMASIYHTEKDDDKNIIRDEIIRCAPDIKDTKCMKFGNYGKLNAQGFIPENTLVENRDILIAKKVPIKENRNDPTKKIKFEDQSKIFRTSEDTFVDMNYTGRNGDGCNFAKTRLRTLRKPMIGDKFASRSAQKGTIGNIVPECDMPFTKNGLRPDIILNPHAIPSRMTIAQLAETLFGKILLELGMFGDGTSFGELDVYTIINELKRCGYESHGNEILYDGYTGKQLETSIFIGPVYYQRLKHMVNDKEHSRAMGPMVNLTRQPAEGRSRDGGFRIGEMERDVMIAHGMSRFCRERLYDVSDKYSVHVCKKCGLIASYNDGDKNRMYASADFTIHLCKTCGNNTDFAKVEVPYAYKLMAQELQTINIVPRIITE